MTFGPGLRWSPWLAAHVASGLRLEVRRMANDGSEEEDRAELVEVARVCADWAMNRPAPRLSPLPGKEPVPSGWVSSKDAADALAVTRQWVGQLVGRGSLRGQLDERNRLWIDPESIEALRAERGAA